VKWEASKNPAGRPISAVVTRSKSGDVDARFGNVRSLVWEWGLLIAALLNSQRGGDASAA
jgi:hypothetical protein